ncbi:MAG: quinol oxidase [Bacteroidetes bacterium]|nr:MAG: quinol oxidase [Bacteroidota bacterium]
MKFDNVKNSAGFMSLAIRLVVGWTYFSAFWRRTVLVNKLDPDLAGYIGEKFNHFLPNALGIKPIIQYLVENPDILWANMVAFTILEGIIGLAIMLGFFTRGMSLGVIGLALGILLGSGWIGTTCLDEWQIGVLGISAGFVLFLTGSGPVSLDHHFQKRQIGFTRKRWFAWLGSGDFPVKQRHFYLIGLLGSLAIFGLTLYTNQVFHGGVWGTLHNKSVKPKLELSDAQLSDSTLQFDVFRTEGVDVYGSWLIGVEVLNESGEAVVQFNQKDLTAIPPEQIRNYYIAKVKPGKHSLVLPLGAKAKVTLYSASLNNLDPGRYKIKLTDISGASWEQEVNRN